MNDISIIKDAVLINIQPNGKEILEEEVSKFGIAINQGNIAHYLMHRIDSHWHCEFELFLLDSGEVELEIHGSHFLFSKGDGCFINSNILHSFNSKTKESKYRSFVFRPSFISGVSGSVFDLQYVSPLVSSKIPFFIFKSNCHHDYIEMFNHAFNVCKNKDFGYEFLLRYQLSKILLYCLQTGELIQFRISPLLDERVKKMILWIDEHLEDEISTTTISINNDVSIRECQRCFEKVLNLTPMAYVRQKRIFKSSEVLRHTDLSITEIAFRYHFSNSSHYSKVFKENIGCTPLQYRKQYHEYLKNINIGE